MRSAALLLLVPWALQAVACSSGALLRPPPAFPRLAPEGGLLCPAGTRSRAIRDVSAPGTLALWCEDAAGVCDGPWLGYHEGRLIASGQYDRGALVAQIGWLQNGWTATQDRRPGDLLQLVLWGADGLPLRFERGKGHQPGRILALWGEAAAGLERSMGCTEQACGLLSEDIVRTLAEQLDGAQPERPPTLSSEPPTGALADHLCREGAGSYPGPMFEPPHG